MIKKLFIIIFIPVTGQLIYSCTSCFGENDNDALPFYDVKNYQSKTYRITGVNEHDMFLFEEIEEDASVNFDKLAISIRASKDYYALNIKGGLFFTGAYACDPLPDGYAGTKELLDSLTITSDYDFNESHQKGSKLNEFFDVYAAATRQSSLSEFMNRDSIQAPEGIGLLLNTSPTSSLLQKFHITLYLSTGEIYKTESKRFKVYQ